jgi:F-type H+-transporting ATPase subunit a
MAEPAGEAGGSAIEIHPMDQFMVGPIFGGENVESFLTITNSTLWMAVAIAAISALLILGMRGRALVPNRWQSIAEVIYGFVRSMVMDVMGEEGKRFFPYIFTIFIFILFCNLLALLPGSFTVTSHIAVTGLMALAVFITVIVLGFIKNGAGFLKLFWIDAAPLALRPPLAIIEVISFFVRPVSHSIRLAGNMMAGHAVLKVFAGFVPALGAFFILPAILPLAMMVAIFGLETLVAVVQAYIFSILTCIYLNDALHPHH